MAEAAVVSVLSSIGKLAAPYVAEQLSPLWGSLKDELGKLKRSFMAIQSIIRNAEERQFAEGAVKSWLLELRDAVYDAEDVLEEFDNEHRRRRLGRIEEVVAEMDKFDFKPDLLPMGHPQSSTSSLPPWRPQVGPSVCEADVVGRGEERDSVVFSLISESQRDHLRNELVEVISIWGMGGAGKTTLAQLVYNDERVVEHFKPRMWVSTPVDFDAGWIVRSMINSATGEECHHSTNMDRLEKKLKEALSGKKYMLVLDDIWNEDWRKWGNFYRILVACGGRQGSRILATTRNEKCLHVMRSQNPLRLSCLSSNDSWDLFERIAFPTPSKTCQALISIGKEIVGRCGGLPLAIKAIGSLMFSKSDITEWAAMLQSEMWSMGIDEQGIRPELKLSYSQLSPSAKQCFALCAIFPKGCSMCKEVLIQLWMANGFIDQKTTGDDIFNALVQRCFLQDVESERNFIAYGVTKHPRTTCIMHDLMYDLAYSFIWDEVVDMRNGSKMGLEVPRSIRHLLVPFGGPPDCAFMNSSTRIRTVLSSYSEFGTDDRKKEDLNREIFKRLRILDLSYVEGGIKLMKSICQFEHLRYLDLSQNQSLEELSEAICRLLNLQTLKLTNCRNLRNLPEVITSMSNLTHLHIDGCTALKRMPANMSLLTSLQTLSKFIVGSDDMMEEGRGIPELNQLNRLGGMLELHNLQAVANAAQAAEANLPSKVRLQALTLHWEDLSQISDDVEQEAVTILAEHVIEALKPPGIDGGGVLKMLGIFGYMGREFPKWMENDMQAIQNLQEIHIIGGRRCVRLPSLWKLHSLKILVLEGLYSVEHLVEERVEETSTLFPSLETLVLRSMKGLEGWWAQGVGRPCFPRLTQLTIRSCPKMKGDNMPRLPSLQRLTTWECPEFGPTLMLEAEAAGNSSLVNMGLHEYHCLFLLLASASSPFWANLASSLERLDIWDCDSMVYFLEDELRTLKSLRVMYISDCKNLQASPPSLQLLEGKSEETLLPSIRDIALMSCNRLESIPQQISRLASLESLSIWDCQAITSLGEEDIWSFLPALKELYISACVNLESLPERGMEGLVSLRSLYIEDCPKLNTFPQGLCQRLPALRYLTLRGCPELQSRCRVDGEYWPLISTIQDKDIGGYDIDGAHRGDGKRASGIAALWPPCCSSSFPLPFKAMPSQLATRVRSSTSPQPT